MTAATCGPQSTWSSPLAAALQRFLEGKRAAGYRYRAEAEGLGVLDRFLRETLSPTDPVSHQRHRARLRGPARDRVRDHAGASADADPRGVSLPRTRRPADVRASGTIPRHPAPTSRTATRCASATFFPTDGLDDQPRPRALRHDVLHAASRGRAKRQPAYHRRVSRYPQAPAALPGRIDASFRRRINTSKTSRPIGS